MLNSPPKPQKLALYLLKRRVRRADLEAMTKLQLTGLILDYDLVLTEESDPVEVILDHEFSHARSRDSMTW